MRYSAGMLRPAGPLVASGRDSEIFEYGPGLVLRRSRKRLFEDRQLAVPPDEASQSTRRRPFQPSTPQRQSSQDERIRSH